MSVTETTEERELRQIREARPFRAREPNWEVLENPLGDSGVPLVAPAPITSPRAFAFRSDARSGRRRAARAAAKNPAAAEKPARRKRKVPDAPAAEETQPRKLTVPRSPHLSSCSRPPPLPAEEPRQEAFRARPVPKSVYDAPPREDAPELPTTVPQPFALASEVRGEAKKAERAPAAAGQAERGGAARDEPAELELTEPQPFALECDLRHELHAARAAARQAAQENADKEQREFRAVRRPSAATPRRAAAPLRACVAGRTTCRALCSSNPLCQRSPPVRP